MLDLEQWHQRFQEQVRWSAPLRDYVNQKIDLKPGAFVLEVGCGTGAILQEYQNPSEKQVRPVGIDIDFQRVSFASRAQENGRFLCGDGLTLPFANGSVDFVFCHYLLLWLKQPVCALREMLRVAKSGGWIVAMAEPDHSGRIDWPEVFLTAGQEQTNALIRQGINPLMGRQLADTFKQAEIEIVEAGITGAQWTPEFSPDQKSTEWLVYQEDLQLLYGQVAGLREVDRENRCLGTRVEFIPTFFVIGKKQCK